MSVKIELVTNGYIVTNDRIITTSGKVSVFKDFDEVVQYLAHEFQLTKIGESWRSSDA